MDILLKHIPNLIESIFRKAAVNKEGEFATHIVAIFSALPIVASLIWHYSHTVVEITDDEHIRWVQNWLTERQDVIRRLQRLSLISSGSMIGPSSHASRYSMLMEENATNNDETENGDRFSSPKLIETPAPGVLMWLWYGWFPLSIEYNAAGKSNSLDAFLPRFLRRMSDDKSGYNVTVWFVPRRVDAVKKILLEGRQLWIAKRSTKTEILTVNESRAMHGRAEFKVITRPSRPMSSVIIEGNVKDELLEDITRFLSGEKWYICKGIPYRRGYLLYGPPGCGKTSLVTALAGQLRLPIVVVSLGGSMGDNALLATLRAAPRDSIVLLEDIDCALPVEKRNSSDDTIQDKVHEIGLRHRQPENNSITLSGLLNAIDGVAAQEGRVLFMTTNYLDRLDDALIRPGRVDVQFHLQNASKSAAGELFDQFFDLNDDETAPTEKDKMAVQNARSAFLEEIEDGKHSFAKLQGALMKARDDPYYAAEEMRKSIVSSPVDNINNDSEKVDECEEDTKTTTNDEILENTTTPNKSGTGPSQGNVISILFNKQSNKSLNDSLSALSSPKGQEEVYEETKTISKDEIVVNTTTTNEGEIVTSQPNLMSILFNKQNNKNLNDSSSALGSSNRGSPKS